MKFKKVCLGVILALVVVCTVVLSSCSKEIASVYYKYKEPTPYVSATKLDALKDYDYVAGKDELVFLTKTENGTLSQKISYLVYNIATEKIIFSAEKTNQNVNYEVNLRLLADKVIVKKSDTTPDAKNYEVKVFDKSGSVLLSKTSDNVIEVKGVFDATQNAEIVKIGSDYYNMVDKGFSATAFDSAFKTIPEGNLINHFSGKDYVVLYNNFIVAYDNNLKLKSIYEIPSYADSFCAPIFFENGKYVFQYIYEAADQSTGEYDFVENGTKYLVETKLINSDNASEKDIDCKFILSDENISAPDARKRGYFMNTGAIVYATDEIVKYKLQEKEILLTVTDGGKFDKFVPFGEDFVSVPVELANGYCLMENKIGQTILISSKGEYVAEITEEFLGCSKNYIVVGDKVYDNNLNKVSLVSSDFTVEQIYYDMIGLRKNDDTCYVLKDGALTKVDGTTVQFDAQIIKSIGATNNYYNANFKKILTCEEDLSLIYSSEDYGVGLMVDEVSKVYYVVKT